MPTSVRSSPFARGLKTVWQSWKRIARRVGDLQARLLLCAFYFLVLAPFAMLIRWRRDPLGIRGTSRATWQRREDPPYTTLEQARRQS